jgi:hypothetical protein
MGVNLGDHPDILQNEGGPFTAINVRFNTINQNNVVAGSITYGTQGFSIDTGSGVGTTDFGYNVGVTTANGSISGFYRITATDVTTSATSHDSFFDPTNGTFARAGSSSAKSTFSNNKNMVTGSAFSNTP